MGPLRLRARPADPGPGHRRGGSDPDLGRAGARERSTTLIRKTPIGPRCESCEGAAWSLPNAWGQAPPIGTPGGRVFTEADGRPSTPTRSPGGSYGMSGPFRAPPRSLSTACGTPTPRCSSMPEPRFGWYRSGLGTGCNGDPDNLRARPQGPGPWSAHHDRGPRCYGGNVSNAVSKSGLGERVCGQRRPPTCAYRRRAGRIRTADLLTPSQAR